MKKVFPIVLFALAIVIVLAGVGFRLWSVEIQRDIDTELSELAAAEQRASSQIAQLNTRLEKPKIEMAVSTTRVPSIKCTTKGFIPKCTTTYREIRTDVPEVVGTEIDPSVATEIGALRADLKRTTDRIEELTKRKQVVEKVADVDKESIRGLLSLLVLLSALYVILSKSYNSDSQKWAFGAVGTVLGYWFGV